MRVECRHVDFLGLFGSSETKLMALRQPQSVRWWMLQTIDTMCPTPVDAPNKHPLSQTSSDSLIHLNHLLNPHTVLISTLFSTFRQRPFPRRVEQKRRPTRGAHPPDQAS